jgi:NAD(P)-dependent dehydrogenase (short-subunit alcohol dehydrogenase family)
MTDRFRNKVVLITGAGQGIGLATAKRMASEGAIIVAGTLDDTQANAVKDYEAVQLDVQHEESWISTMDSLVKSHGGLDVLINNAGISPQATAEETTPEFWDEVMAINLRGSFLGCQKAIPLMRKRGGGAIVNVASINGIRGNRRLVAYAATKGAIVSMTMSLALDHSQDNIRVNCVCPATIDTAMPKGMIAEAPDPALLKRQMNEKHPIGRIGQPEEVASTIAFLASEDASFMTGLAIPVDGGRSIR